MFRGCNVPTDSKVQTAIAEDSTETVIAQLDQHPPSSWALRQKGAQDNRVKMRLV